MNVRKMSLERMDKELEGTMILRLKSMIESLFDDQRSHNAKRIILDAITKSINEFDAKDVEKVVKFTVQDEASPITKRRRCKIR